jgi:hypothetical protein
VFKPHFGICVCHGKKRLIVVKSGLCAEGNRKKKGIKKTKVKAKKKTGELDLFYCLWEKREKQCECCDIHLAYFNVIYFSHILPKGAYPTFRLREDNISIMCEKCHYDWDFGNRNQDKFLLINEKHQKLRYEYNTRGKTFSEG